MNLFGSSRVLDWGRRIGKKIKETAQQSLLLGPRDSKKPKKTKAYIDIMEHSRLAAVMNLAHPIDKTVESMGKSSIFGWLYHYWSRFCATPVWSILCFLFPLLGILTLQKLQLKDYPTAGAYMIILLLSYVIFTEKEKISNWLSGSWIGRWVRYPVGERDRSVTVYLTVVGFLGGLIGWKYGSDLGIKLAAILALAPAAFYAPPIVVTCALLAFLPLLETTLCWGLSVFMIISHLFSRAFRGEGGKPIDGVDLLLLVFPIFCLVSAAFSYDQGDSIKVIFMWLGLFACMPIARRAINSRAHLKAALWSFAGGTAATGLYGLYQSLSGMENTTWTDTALFESLELRVYSTFENPNVYGEFLLLAMPLVAGFALHFKGWKRWSLLGLEFLLLINLVMTYSRGCYVGLLLTALVFLWNYSKKWTITALAVGIPLALIAMPASVMERISSIGDMSDTSTSYRVMIYVGTFMMLKRFWLSGVGIGEKAFNVLYPYYAMSGITAPHSHSLFFQVTVSFGIAGLIYLFVVLGFFQRRVNYACKKTDSVDRPLLLGFKAVFWGFMVQSAFDYSWYNYRVFQLFWLVIVMGFAAAELLKQKDKEEKL